MNLDLPARERRVSPRRPEVVLHVAAPQNASWSTSSIPAKMSEGGMSTMVTRAFKRPRWLIPIITSSPPLRAKPSRIDSTRGPCAHSLDGVALAPHIARVHNASKSSDLASCSNHGDRERRTVFHPPGDPGTPSGSTMCTALLQYIRRHLSAMPGGAAFTARAISGWTYGSIRPREFDIRLEKQRRDASARSPSGPHHRSRAEAKVCSGEPLFRSAPMTSSERSSNVQGLHVLSHLVGGRRTGDDAAHIAVLQTPRGAPSEPSDIACDRLESPRLPDAFRQLLPPCSAPTRDLRVRAAYPWHVVVLAGEETTGERAPDRGAEPDSS